MFRTKRDVDRHVSHILNRIREEKERNSRGYQFAKLYYDVADYESSKRYLQAFLSVREAVPQAHKLLGQTWEALGDKTKAIEAYKRSLDLDPDQKDLILKVCELYTDRSVAVNTENAKFWIVKAEKHFPNNYAVFKLKERVIDQDSDGDKEELEHLISTELVSNPTDVHLHIKLLRLFIKSNNVDRAYAHAIDTEKTMAFVHSMDWYECLADVYRVYQDQQGLAGDAVFHTHRLFALASLIHLRLQTDERDTLSVIRTLHQFDVGLQEASELQKQSVEWTSFLTEMKGQLFYLMAIVLIKRASKGQLSWKDASMYSGVCFLISGSLPSIDQRSSWYCQLPADRKKFYTHLYMVGCDRLSQGGHMIYSLANKQDGSMWARKLRQSVCTVQGRDSIYSVLFTSDDMKRQKDCSFLIQSNVFTSTKVDVPTKPQLLEYDEVTYSHHSSRLHQLVWLCLQYHSLKEDTQPAYEQQFGYQLYPDMKFSVVDLSGGDPSSLCQLDVQVFLYVCVRWAALQQRERKRNLHVIAHKPDLLPACLSSHLCTSQQEAWWAAVYKMENKTSREKLSTLWGVVLRGLETVRLVSPHILPLPLIVHVAKTLDTRAKEMEALDGEGLATRKLLSTQTRAGYYWRAADDMLGRIERNVSIKLPKETLFPGDTFVDLGVTKEFQEQVKFAMAMVAMREEEYEEALLGFESLAQPEASFYTGLIYKRMTENLNSNANESAGSSDKNNQEMVLLTKSKNSLYQTLDRLENNQNEELKEEVTRELDDVTCKLITLETGGALIDSTVSNQNYSTAESEVDSADEEPSKHAKTPVLPSPIQRREPLQPSPTRIEVQFRALEATNSALGSRMSTLEETVRTQEKLVQEVFKQLRESRDETKALRDESKGLRDQLQLISLTNMALPRPPMPPQTMTPQSFPGTPQQRAMLNAMNSPYGAGVPYDYQAAPGIPPHMSQFGYQQQGNSPRPGSAYGQQPSYEEDYSNVDGEFYDPDTDGDYYISDQNLIPDWPFGHKAGVEGKSTITYSPHNQPRGMAPGNAGAFVNALRGQSIQYGGFQQQTPAGLQQPQAPQMPGPGFFSQNSQQNVQPPVQQTQPGMMIPGQGHAGTPGVAKPTSSPAITSLLQQKVNTPGQPNVSKVATSIMPPNAVASPSTEAKPKLIPGSVGVPTPKKDEKPQVASSQAGLLSTPSVIPPGSAAGVSVAVGKTPPPASQGTAQPTSFMGFSFTSTPKISETKSDDKTQENNAKAPTAEAAPKPFGGFSFTTPKPATSSTAATSGVGPSPAFGQAALPSFGSLAASGGTATAFQGGEPKGFSGAGTTLFGKSPPPPRRRDASICSDEHIVDEYEPNVDFKPVVPLPDLVDVKTGEEDEDQFFCERAKLFRFDSEANQWKERGIGEMKILRHKQSKKLRILMRREQVLKLCANHFVNKEMKLTPMASSDRAWVWTAQDFAEEEMKQEKFAVKFKTEDLAEKFKQVFIKYQAEIDDGSKSDESPVKDKKAVDKAPEKTSNQSGTASAAELLKPKVASSDAGAKQEDAKSSKPAASAKSGNGAGQMSLAELCKPKAGSWTCDGCLVQNDGDLLQCPCCNKLKPGVKPEDIKSKQPAATFGQSSGGFKFGSQPSDANSGNQASGGFKFASQSSAADTSSGSGFKFGSQASTTTSTTDTSLGSGFKFGTPAATDSPKPSSGFTFATPTTSATSQPATGFVFGSKPTVAEATKAPGGVSSGTGLNLPEPCKPTSGFTFGGVSHPAADSSTEQGSAGFAVNKDSSQYVFGGVQKSGNTAEPDSTTQESAASNVGNSLLAKFLLTPDSWKCSSCSVSNDGELDNCSECGISREEGMSTIDIEKTSMKPTGPTTATGSIFGNPSGTPASSGLFGTKSSTSTEGTGKGFAFGGDAAEKKSDSFVFGSPQKTAFQGFKFTLKPEPDAEKQAAQPAQLGSGFHFALKPTSTPVKSPIKSPGPKSPEITEDGLYLNKDGDDAHIHFDPIIELPEQVEVKTGEEDEETIFSHRAKLYRFVNGEWKERGLGDVKVLFNREEKKARILMRREQILKLCCNHYITPGLKFQPMPNSKDCALVWYAMDFADDEPKNEQFSIKFKSPDIATKFESAVEDAKARIECEIDKSNKKSAHVETIGKTSDKSVDNDEVIFVKEETATDEQISQARKYQLPDNFYLYEKCEPCPGCRGCHDLMLGEESGADGEDDDDEYEDVESEEEDDEYDEEEEEEEDQDGGDDLFTAPPSSGAVYISRLLSTDREEGTETAVEGITGDQSRPLDIRDPEPEKKPEEFVFGSSGASAFSFSSLAATKETFKTDESKPFAWRGQGKQLFGAGGGEEGGGSGDDGDVAAGDDPHFEPIVPLPDLVDVKTGEEEETAQFSNRAKLFRFDKDTNQWKEKGIGEMKILRHNTTGAYRLLLRREQVHKLACNHRLTSKLALKPMNTSETTWCWIAQDFSDTEPKIEQLAVKFKTIELAKTFKDKFEEIQAELRASPEDD